MEGKSHKSTNDVAFQICFSQTIVLCLSGVYVTVYVIRGIIIDKTRSEIIRKDLEIPVIQDVRTNYKQNWIIHLERMDNSRLPKHTLNYEPRRQRDLGRPRKRWQRVDAGTGQKT